MGKSAQHQAMRGEAAEELHCRDEGDDGAEHGEVSRMGPNKRPTC